MAMRKMQPKYLITLEKCLFFQSSIRHDEKTTATRRDNPDFWRERKKNGFLHFFSFLLLHLLSGRFCSSCCHIIVVFFYAGAASSCHQVAIWKCDLALMFGLCLKKREGSLFLADSDGDDALKRMTKMYDEVLYFHFPLHCPLLLEKCISQRKKIQLFLCPALIAKKIN